MITSQVHRFLIGTFHAAPSGRLLKVTMSRAD